MCLLGPVRLYCQDCLTKFADDPYFFQECQDSLLKRRVQGCRGQLRSLCDEGVVEVPGWRDIYNALCTRCMDERGVESAPAPNARKEWEKVDNETMARARLRAAEREQQSQASAASRVRGRYLGGKGRGSKGRGHPGYGA